MNRHYRSIMVSRVVAALGAAQSVTSLSHQGVKGTVREVLVRELFRPLLPSDMGVGSGQIASSSGELSSQQDVVIYDRRILPPVLFEEVLGLFPVEAVLATIEVKTKLTAMEILTAHSNAVSVRSYEYLHGQEDEADRQRSHLVQKVVSCVFALSTDLAPAGKSELQRYLEINTNADPAVRSICVAGRGNWFFSDKWHHVGADSDQSETLTFVAGLYDALGRIAESRCRPRLAGYVTEVMPRSNTALEPTAHSGKCA